MRIVIRYYRVHRGNGFWCPTARMKALGFQSVPCGQDGPDAWKIAESWNERWQRTRRGLDIAPVPAWPPRSLGEAFDRYRRSDTWAGKAPRTREDWERGWKHVSSIFGDVDPSTVKFEHLDKWYHGLKSTNGVREAHRAMKIWRALWIVAAAMGYCQKGADPSSGVRRETPAARSATWLEGEVVRLVKAAWRQGYHALAVMVAISYDSGLSPVDVRSLKLSHSRTDGRRVWFETGRTKTGREAIGTLTPRTVALLNAYLAELPVTFHPETEIFRTRQGAPYRKNSLSEDFRDVRRIVFPGDDRKLMDMRRTTAFEAMAGGVDAGSLSAKMANTISDSKALQRTYLPVNHAAVDLADEARKRGRKAIGENKEGRKVAMLTPGVSQRRIRNGS